MITRLRSFRLAARNGLTFSASQFWAKFGEYAFAFVLVGAAFAIAYSRPTACRRDNSRTRLNSAAVVLLDTPRGLYRRRAQSVGRFRDFGRVDVRSPAPIVPRVLCRIALFRLLIRSDFPNRHISNTSPMWSPDWWLIQAVLSY
jgi:hypothetical protein